MFVIVLISFLVFILLYVYRNNFYNYWTQRNIVQHSDIFVKFLFSDRSIAEIYKDIYDEFSSDTYIGSFNGIKKDLVLRDLRDVQAVLTHDFESFHSRGFVLNDDDILGHNLLTITDYKQWKLIRQKVSPIFTSAKLKNMCYIMEKCANDFVEMVKENKEMRDKPFNALYTYTTASIGASVFGIDTNMKSSMDSPFLDMAWKTLEPSFKSNFQFFISNVSPTLFRLFKCKPFGQHEEFFVTAVKRVLKMRRNDSKAVHDFIDLGLELQKNGVMRDLSTGYELEPTDEVIAAQAFFFFLAGTDTSANTMHFTLLELSSNPHVLKKVHEEIDRTFDKFQGKITYEAIESMQYLDMVLNEATRKYPPIGIMRRECTKSTVLPVGNLKVDKGILITVPVLGIHRDPKYFPNPDVFDPERFAPENIGSMEKYAFMPFGEGKRMCIGNRYAKLQVKAGLMFLLRSFTLKEQNYRPKHFEKSVFAVRDSKARYDFIERVVEQ